MAEQAEAAFVKNFTNNLSAQPVTYPDDFQPPPESYLKKVPVLPVDLPEPPKREHAETSAAGAVKLTFKSLKPAQSYTLSVSLADTIAVIKSQLANEAGAPPADVQRLLLKGKALADAKLLKEYDVKDGDTLNLMVKPGYQWDPSKVSSGATTETPPTPVGSTAQELKPITLLPEPTRPTRGHGRIPSVVLSPSPSLTALPDEKVVDIPLVLDTSNIPSSPTGGPESTYHTEISQPEFWERLYGFLSSEFSVQSDAVTAWEDFFCSSKGTLSVSEIAKIRDKVGVTGMAGT
ncbi:hypothetical protein QCA50_011465 [Cerrena zonata]|uniref:Ubiquitin-like domain-containing protein n=1 Tax=Cerrena zonata TaxID=2478898 RepID=A0AAW0FVM6_9APHY